ncbi:hypothetical protein fugu_009421 [Takifugu bimaculatus]|uniref:SOWAHA-C winged helix-turn-helix domain-containing protein n=1 Tax=Takifugu bimaculatus TaxID=433685 RepID=A0A4Z2AYK8_9TELE|nr:hypothetical protein fugu_009421 [Takifugu bimaculatus]
MALTQESVLFRLINEGGQVKKSEIVSHFRGLLDGVDPAEKQRNRELFKTFVNSVATVREIDGVRYVVLKKVYRHLLKRVQAAEEPDHGEIRRPGEPRSPPEEAGGGSSGSGAGEESSSEGPAELLSPVELALRRSQRSSFRTKKMLNFEVQQACGGRERAAAQSKPYALPLRVPVPLRVPARVDLTLDPPAGSTQASPQSERRSGLKEHGCSSPQLRRAVRGDKAPEELREVRASSSTVPLEDPEHKWMLRCAAGHWGHVYGLLLTDSHLAEKRDFMSGFTALHWAAKWGNGNMLVKIIDLAKKGGVQIDINTKTHGGYTPLHIAALHNQEYIIAMLMGEYDADPNIRDNCGKRPHHYLRPGASESVREMLVKPKAPPPPEMVQSEREEPDPARGRHSIGRLFQPHVAGQKKKLKQRTGLSSLCEEYGEERQDGAVIRNRTASDARM